MSGLKLFELGRVDADFTNYSMTRDVPSNGQSYRTKAADTYMMAYILNYLNK